MAQFDADRDLLFGILAVQNGLIEQGDLIGAIETWSRNKSSPIAQVLVERGVISEHDRSLLEGLVERHVAKHGSASCAACLPWQRPDHWPTGCQKRPPSIKTWKIHGYGRQSVDARMGLTAAR